MPTITLSTEFTTKYLKEMILWQAVTCGDIGSTYEVPNWATSLTVQAHGTFTDDASPADTATLTMQGSNDGTNWSTLHADDGNNATFTAAGMEIIAELPRYIRPSLDKLSGGDVDVYLFVRRA